MRARAGCRDPSPEPGSGLETSSEQGQQRLLGLSELRAAETVSLYMSRRGEFPTELIFDELTPGVARVVLPRIEQNRIHLHVVRSHSDLSPGYGGISEPDPGLPSVAPEEVDLFVVPGLCFDRHGARLGRGGGHFDRLLGAAGTRALRIGLCYQSQIVERVPVEDWDQRMDLLVTESEIIRTERT